MGKRRAIENPDRIDVIITGQQLNVFDTLAGQKPKDAVVKVQIFITLNVCIRADQNAANLRLPLSLADAQIGKIAWPTEPKAVAGEGGFVPNFDPATVGFADP
jgi:hypothetical protein